MEVKVILDKEDYDQLALDNEQRAAVIQQAEIRVRQLQAEITRLEQQIAAKPVVRVDDPNEPWGDTGRTYNAGGNNVFWDRNGLWINTGQEHRIYLGEGATLDAQ